MYGVFTPLAHHGAKLSDFIMARYDESRRKVEEEKTRQKRLALEDQNSRDWHNSMPHFSEKFKRYKSWLSRNSVDGDK